MDDDCLLHRCDCSGLQEFVCECRTDERTHKHQLTNVRSIVHGWFQLHVLNTQHRICSETLTFSNKSPKRKEGPLKFLLKTPKRFCHVRFSVKMKVRFELPWLPEPWIQPWCVGPGERWVWEVTSSAGGLLQPAATDHQAVAAIKHSGVIKKGGLWWKWRIPVERWNPVRSWWRSAPLPILISFRTRLVCDATLFSSPLLILVLLKRSFPSSPELKVHLANFFFTYFPH